MLCFIFSGLNGMVGKSLRHCVSPSPTELLRRKRGLAHSFLSNAGGLTCLYPSTHSPSVSFSFPFTILSDFLCRTCDLLSSALPSISFLHHSAFSLLSIHVTCIFARPKVCGEIIHYTLYIYKLSGHAFV